MTGEGIIGEGRKGLSGESPFLPSPNPTPPSPKTFDFIESLLQGLPASDLGSLHTEFIESLL